MLFLKEFLQDKIQSPQVKGYAPDWETFSNVLIPCQDHRHSQLNGLNRHKRAYQAVDDRHLRLKEHAFVS
jgi:hypothetical protein